MPRRSRPPGGAAWTSGHERYIETRSRDQRGGARAISCAPPTFNGQSFSLTMEDASFCEEERTSDTAEGVIGGPPIKNKLKINEGEGSRGCISAACRILKKLPACLRPSLIGGSIIFIWCLLAAYVVVFYTQSVCQSENYLLVRKHRGSYSIVCLSVHFLGSFKKYYQRHISLFSCELHWGNLQSSLRNASKLFIRQNCQLRRLCRLHK